MRVVRLAKRKHADPSGIGSTTGARWNSVGKQVVYTASCGALAVLEYLAHIPTGILPAGLLLMQIEVPDNLKMEVVHDVPADALAFTRIGDEWLDSGATAVLQVPAVLVPRQKNYLLNPHHPLFGAVSVLESYPFAFDSRLLSFTPIAQ